MTIKQTSSIMGLFSIFAGVFISIFSFNPSPVIKYMLILALFGVSIFALITSYRCKKNQVPSIDYWLTGVISIAYAITLFLLANSLSQFLKVSAVFVLFFGITNFTFIFSALNYRPKANMNIILIKGAMGLIAAVAGVLVLTTLSANSAVVALLILGIIKILIGISFTWVTKYFFLSDLKTEFIHYPTFTKK